MPSDACPRIRSRASSVTPTPGIQADHSGQLEVAQAGGHRRRHAEKIDRRQQRLRLLEAARERADRHHHRGEQKRGRRDDRKGGGRVRPGDRGLGAPRDEVRPLENRQRHRRQVEDTGERRQRGDSEHLAPHERRAIDRRRQRRLQRASLALSRGDVDRRVKGPQHDHHHHHQRQDLGEHVAAHLRSRGDAGRGDGEGRLAVRAARRSGQRLLDAIARGGRLLARLVVKDAHLRRFPGRPWLHLGDGVDAVGGEIASDRPPLATTTSSGPARRRRSSPASAGGPTAPRPAPRAPRSGLPARPAPARSPAKPADRSPAGTAPSPPACADRATSRGAPSPRPESPPGASRRRHSPRPGASTAATRRRNASSRLGASPAIARSVAGVPSASRRPWWRSPIRSQSSSASAR